MSVRAKLFTAMSLLVVMMGVAYLLSTQGFMRNHLPGVIADAERGKTDKWVSAFQEYYREHGNSWTGVNTGFSPYVPNLTVDAESSSELDVALFSPDEKWLFTASGTHSQDQVRKGLKVELKVDGKLTGIVYFYDQELIQTLQLQQKVYEDMARVALKVIGVISLIALLIGFWLSRMLTYPLEKLTAAIGRIGQGELGFALPVTTRDEYGKVTDALNRMSASLARSEEVRKHLVADVAHELRTPLTILQGQFEWIQQNGQAVSPERLLPMQDEVLRLRQLVNDLHQLSLAEAGKLPLHLKKTNLHELLEKLVELFQAEADEAGVRLTLESAIPSDFMLDSHRITQVFYNLIGNAIRHTPSGGQVTIKIAGEIGKLLVSITDTGRGIATDHLPHVFDRFYRVEEDRARHSGGMGLGLSISKQFVEAHGGQIDVASIVGEGTVFTVSLPC